MFDQQTLTPPVVLYARVSSDKQAEAQSIQGQIEALNRFCERAGIVPSATYMDDGESGDLPWADRPGALQVLDAARSGNAKTVLVYLYDRFSRNVYEGISAARLLKAAGATPYSINEPFDVTTTFGEYMFVQSLNNAQLWKAQFLEKTRSGRDRKARAGQWMGGVVPYGYRVAGRQTEARLVPLLFSANGTDGDPCPSGGSGITASGGLLALSEAGIVRWMYDQVVNHGATTYGLANALNAMSVPTRSTSSEPGSAGPDRTRSLGPRRGLWLPAQVYRILVSTTYRGVHQFGKRGSRRDSIIERPCEPLVSPETWRACRLALTANAQYSRRQTDREYLLRGLIRCEACGRTFTGACLDRAIADATGNARGIIYACNARKGQGSSLRGGGRLSRAERCTTSSVPGSIEQVVWGDICAMLRNPEALAQRISEKSETVDADLDKLYADGAAINRLIEQKSAERAQVMRQLRRLRINEAESDAQMDEIDTEEATLRERLRAITGQIEAAGRTADAAGAARSLVETIAATLEGNGDDLPFERKRRVVEQLVAGISVREVTPCSRGRRGEIDVTITYRFGDVSDARKAAF